VIHRICSGGMGDIAEAAGRERRPPPPLGARALSAAIMLGDRDAVEKILDSGAWALLFGGALGRACE
jgi:hypothetical protein